MIPPWKKFPEYPVQSMFWRMGIGEHHWFKFERWLARKTLDEKQRYAADNPESEGWAGYWAGKGLSVWPYGIMGSA